MGNTHSHGQHGHGDHKELVFEIYRHAGEGQGSFLSRVCKDKATGVSPTGGDVLTCAGGQILLQGR